MKILWLCNMMLPRIAQELSITVSNGGGWLTGLSNDLSKIDDIELIVCFPIVFQKELLTGQVDKLKYYGVPQAMSDLTKYDHLIEQYFEKILKETNPDVVHIFGTEFPHTLAMTNTCKKIGIVDKVVINIQGLTSICAKHYYASMPNKVVNKYTLRDFIKQDNIKQQAEKFEKRGIYEIQALKNTNHIIGRTDWDRACSEQINTNAEYHFCNETLRDEFYKHKWKLDDCERHSIFISQCSYPIKGFHFMLEAMPEILKQYPDAHIYTTGSNPLALSIKEKIKQTYYMKYLGMIIKMNHLEKCVTFLGGLNEQQMCDRFLKSHIFVSPSSIENSPNSLGEAMLLGVPSVVSDVGGVKNMLIHNKDGTIYQHNAPYMLAYYVTKIFAHNELALQFSENSKKHAQDTHNRTINLQTILGIYEAIAT